MRHIVFGVVLTLASSAFAQTASVEDRVTKQNALFDEFYETGLKNSPERATSYGDYRYNAQLGQYSLAEIARQHAEADDFLKRLKAIPTDGMSDKDLLSHRVLERQLEREDVNYKPQELRDAGEPAEWRAHTARRFTAQRAAGFGAALPGLHFPAAPDSARAGSDHGSDAAGEKDGSCRPSSCSRSFPRNVTASSRRIHSSCPRRSFRPNFPSGQEAPNRRDDQGDERRSFSGLQEVRGVSAHRVRRRKDVSELSVESLPDGKRRYAEAVKLMTTMNITPAEVHEIGLKEVERITAEMTKLAQAQGHKDLAELPRGDQQRSQVEAQERAADCR